MRHGLGVRRGLCSASERVRVLIVGGGPVGLYASSLLSSYGVPSLLIDKQAAPSPHPRAHMINARSMELLRQLGVEDEVRSLTPPLSEWSHFVYTSSLHSAPIASQDHTATPEWRRLLSCSSSLPAHLSQPKLEAVLRAEAARRGGRMLDSTPLLSLKPHATGVQAVLGGEGGERVVEADHVLACDGAHSHVRSLLGLELRGPPTLVRFSSVHFSCPPLEVPPAMLYFVFNPSAVAVLVAHNIQQGEWVAQIPFFGREPSEAECKAQLEACVGEGVSLTIHSCSAWGMKAKVDHTAPLFSPPPPPSTSPPLSLLSGGAAHECGKGAPARRCGASVPPRGSAGCEHRTVRRSQHLLEAGSVGGGEGV